MAQKPAILSCAEAMCLNLKFCNFVVCFYVKVRVLRYVMLFHLKMQFDYYSSINIIIVPVLYIVPFRVFTVYHIATLFNFRSFK